MIPFWKVHGAGNDFVLIDAVDEPVAVDGARARAWCDRHRGVGADGVLLVSRDPDGGPRMRIWNADGSAAEMCGNGIRCVARHLSEVRGLADDPLPIRTDAGLRPCTIVSRGPGPWQVRVGMGVAAVEAQDERAPAGGASHVFRRVDVGNPHAIVWSDDPWADARRHGPTLEVADAFPRRTNVEFVRRVGPDAVQAVVHERGCGITEACGTGATAVFAALCARGEHDPARALTVHLPGGAVVITRERDGDHLLMTGPAEVAFTGLLPD